MSSATQAAMVFWRWFAAKAEQLRSAYGADDLAPFVAEVEAGLARLGRGVRWEVGPHDEAGEMLFFALGAAGDRDQLRRNREVVAGAPDVPGWVFLAAKPAKRWRRRRAQIRYAGERRWVDFDRWGFSARPTRAGAVVRFVARDVAACEASTLEGLGWLLLDWELGEERAMDEVADVVMVDALEDECCHARHSRERRAGYVMGISDAAGLGRA
ncbi:MAG: hypothetical protein RL885_13490 [Planctomycetota bacterium]